MDLSVPTPAPTPTATPEPGGDGGGGGDGGPLPDITPPGAPTNLNIEGGSPTTDDTPTFTWNPAFDLGGIASYEVSLDGGAFTNIGNTTSYTVPASAALLPGSHTFAVRALDVALPPNLGTTATLAFTVEPLP